MKTWLLRGLIAGALLTGGLRLAEAAIPTTLAFQGKLTDQASQPLTGNQTVTFRLFDAATGGAKLWEETQTVAVSGGLFSVLLGSVTPLTLSFDQPYWIETQVGAELLSPRQPLSSSPYARTAARVEGLTMLGGNVGIGTAVPATKLEVSGGTFQHDLRVSSPSVTGTGIELANTNVNATWQMFVTGSSASAGGGVLAWWDNTNYRMILSSSSLRLGLSPNSSMILKYDYPGNGEIPAGGYFGSTGSGGYSFIASATGGTPGATLGGYYYDGATYRSAYQISNTASGFGNLLLMKSGGNVGIGTSNPTVKLEVNGAARLAPTSPPAAPAPGTIYFDGTHFLGWNGSAWKQLDN